MKIDTFASEQHRQAFAKKQAAVLRTAEVLKLDPANSVFFGGAALALYGVDASYGFRRSFDAEAYLSDEKFAELEKWQRHQLIPAAIPGIAYIPRQPGTLPFTGFGIMTNEQFTNSLGHENFTSAQAAAVVLHGLAALPLDRLVRGKLAAGRIKDAAGIIKAHIVAHANGEPLAYNPSWREQVTVAVHALRAGHFNRPGLFGFMARLPSWMKELQANNFDHPAFAGMDLRKAIPAETNTL